jgi:tetratricopeptide (TPR) repeat protein
MQAAGEQYRVAASQDPAMAPAWYNLADLLDAEGRLEEAIEALLRALDAEPLYADAHYNLARLYEATARPLKAASHWRRYVELDPSSNWARVARHRLAACAGGPRLLAERDDGGRA